MFERFTDRARRVIVLAQDEARQRGDAHIGAEHLLLGLTDVDDGTGLQALEQLGVRPRELRARLDERLEPADAADAADAAAAAEKGEPDEAAGAAERADTRPPEGATRPRRGNIPFAHQAKKVLELSLREAIELGHRHIGTEHVLLGILREQRGVAAEVLYEQGVEYDAARKRVAELAVARAEAPPRMPGSLRERLDHVEARLDKIVERLDALERRLHD